LADRLALAIAVGRNHGLGGGAERILDRIEPWAFAGAPVGHERVAAGRRHEEIVIPFGPFGLDGVRFLECEEMTLGG